MSIVRKIYYSLNVKQRIIARRLFFLPIDIVEKITGKRPPMVPPRGLIFTGSGDFVKQGDTFLNYFKKYGGLKPEHRVLDIGSGIGRMARPLVGYLNEKGTYEGFDVVRTGVEWCQNNITSADTRFKFKHTPLKNDLYNLDTPRTASNFRFPYPDADFDFCFLTSVFTHMLPEDTSNYLKEISRTLKPGGICFATFFVLDDISTPAMKNNSFRFDYSFEGYALMDEKVKEANVAFEIDWLKKVFSESGLNLKSFYPGIWSSRKDNTLDFQDILIFEKK
ncbi:MAG: class I SAM-dependent methyltransferase [Flavobacteriales bacterium]